MDNRYPPQNMPPQQMAESNDGKMKSEDYQLLGGINTKVSLYSNGPAEFRDLSNLNFVNTGALTKRPGTTLYGGSTLSGFGFPSVISGAIEFSKLNGSSFLIVGCGQYLYQVPISGTPVQVVSFNDSIIPSITPGSNVNFASFVDHLFSCDGSHFQRIAPEFYGVTVFQAFMYSLPSGTTFATIFNTFASLQLGGLSGTYVFSYSFVNDRGYVGPPAAGVTITIGGFTQAPAFEIGYCQYLSLYYGVTAIQFWRSEVDGVNLFAATLAPFHPGGGNTITLIDYGSTLVANAASAPNTFNLIEVGASIVMGFTLPLGTVGMTFSNPFMPRYLEVFNNQLFMAGFSTAPSTFWWSQIGEPEGVEPEFSSEVRTNDSDVISGLINYFGSLVITKRRSIHLLSGDNPDDFLLQELSNQYGCLSHRAMVTWNNVLWFLDSKGVMEYNGANIHCVSDPIEPIFNQMNVQAAYDNACALHVKKYNEIWFFIPVNGSTVNNQIIVYDYVAKSWTHYDGVQAQCLFNAFAGFPNQAPFAGNYTGGLVYFDASLTQDNGQGMTCSFDSIFFAARGQTTENMYRRFYLNVDPVIGFTQPINMTFKTNFGSTVQLSRTMYQAPYQSRIDFGLSARSIQASMYHYSASLPLKINGFTVESRFQRSV